MNSILAKVVLWVLLLLGFLGAVKISYANFSGSSCPHIGFIPICYVVLVAYGLMILSQLIPNLFCKHYLFSAGWGAAFLIALVGSIAEVVAGGGVCPTSGGGGIRGACFRRFNTIVFCIPCDAHNHSDSVFIGSI